jgi:hypothetical protein
MSNSKGAVSEYAVVLVRSNIDRFEHHVLFARELTHAFASAGITLIAIDYIAEPRKVFDALKDPNCLFFVCFNGFGSELRFPSGWATPYRPAFSAFNKYLFDIMHDCPAHESMAHQLNSNFAERILLMTDFGYAGMAELSAPHVNYVPSITFPKTLPSVKPIDERSIDILLPVTLAPPSFAEERHAAHGSHKSKVYRSLFYDVSDQVCADWRLNPITELVKACREIGIALNWQDADDRFLLTTVLDRVKFLRRQRLLTALAHLPMTVVTDRNVDLSLANSRVTFAQSRSVTDLLFLMADSRVVISPSPHLTGFHERPLAALTAGAALVSSPNKALEADLVHWRDLVFFEKETELAGLLEALLGNARQMRDIAEQGRRKALELYPPERLVKTILSLLHIRLGKAIGAMRDTAPRAVAAR